MHAYFYTFSQRLTVWRGLGKIERSTGWHGRQDRHQRGRLVDRVDMLTGSIQFTGWQGRQGKGPANVILKIQYWLKNSVKGVTLPPPESHTEMRYRLRFVLKPPHGMVQTSVFSSQMEVVSARRLIITIVREQLLVAHSKMFIQVLNFMSNIAYHEICILKPFL